MCEADWHRVATAEDMRCDENGTPVAVLMDDVWVDLSTDK